LVDYYSDMTGSLDSAGFFSENYASNQTFTNREVDAYRSRLSFNQYWSEGSKSTVTAYYRANSVKQNPSYRVRDDFKPWIPSGDPSLAHGEVNDNRFKSFGLIAQHKQDVKWLRGNIVVGGSLDRSPNNYEANYIRIRRGEEGLYESFVKTDSLLADYTANLMNLAAYTQVKIELLPGLNLIGALRYDQFNYDFDNHLGANAFTAVLDGKNTFTRLTPKTGLTYDLKNNRGVYANFSQGFVPPQVSELYRGNEIPALKPVYYDNFEAGGWISFARSRAKLDLGVYQMDGVNEIISVLLDDGTRVRQNAGETTHRGVEYGLSFFLVSGGLYVISCLHSIHEIFS